MFWLLVFGLVHFYLIWFGDILAAYALVGCSPSSSATCRPRALIRWGDRASSSSSLVLMAARRRRRAPAGRPRPPAHRDPGNDRGMAGACSDMFGATEPGPELPARCALYPRRLGRAWSHDRLDRPGAEPFMSCPVFGWETLAYMLLGMAALKSGFLTGGWSVARYRRIGPDRLRDRHSRLCRASPGCSLRDGFSVPDGVRLSLGGDGAVPAGHGGRRSPRSSSSLTRKGGCAGRPDRRRRAAPPSPIISALSLVMTTLFYGYGVGPVRPVRAGSSCGCRDRDVGADAALVEALARPLPLRPARMAVALLAPMAPQPMRKRTPATGPNS